MSEEKRNFEEYNREIRVKGVPITQKTELKNLAQNLGVNESNIIKTYLPDLLSKYPEHLKQPPIKD